MSKRNLGFGWRRSRETAAVVFKQEYGLLNLSPTLKHAKEDFKEHQVRGNVSLKIKPVYFKVLIEDIKEAD
jgi:hypothetical protein